jgi:hypothetical protein
MSVKFKIGFQIDAETLFGIIAKFLPVEKLSVEELPVKPTLTERSTAIHKLTQRAITKHKPRRPSRGANLDKGINKIIVTALKDGSKRATEFKPLAVAGGFSPHSINSRLEDLHQAGVVERDGDRGWKLKNDPT